MRSKLLGHCPKASLKKKASFTFRSHRLSLVGSFVVMIVIYYHLFFSCLVGSFFVMIKELILFLLPPPPAPSKFPAEFVLMPQKNSSHQL